MGRATFQVSISVVFLILAAGAPRALSNPTDAQATAALRRYLDGAAAEGFTGAVLVARGSDVLLAQGYGLIAPGSSAPVTAETVFTTGSITKQFTAAAILVLERRGELSVQDPIGRVLDGVPEDKRGITLHHLLTHTAGFPGAIGDDMERIGRDDFVRRALSTPLQFEPGTAYEYTNVGYSLLAAIVELVSGTSYESFLQRELFEPAGMHDTGYRLPAWDPSRLAHGVRDDGSDWGTVVERAIGKDGPGWNLVGNGGIHSTVWDMFRWHQALAGDAILTDDEKGRMYSKQADEGGGSWYGYGWSLEETPWGRLITHNGGNPYFFADFLRYVDEDVVVYYTTSSRDRRMRRLARPLARIVFTGEIPAFPASPPVGKEAAEVDMGPPAPERSLEAKWGLPASYRGTRAAELLEAITKQDSTWRSQFISSCFAPSLLESRGTEALASSLESLRRELGSCRVARAWPEASGVVVELTGSGVPTRLEIGLEPEPPHRIVSIGITKGD